MLNYLENLSWPEICESCPIAIARFVLIGQDAFRCPRRTVTAKNIQSGSIATGNVTLRNIAKEAMPTMERNVILEALRSNQWNRRQNS